MSENDSNERSGGTSRRRFLKTSGAGALAASMAGCEDAAHTVEPDVYGAGKEGLRAFQFLDADHEDFLDTNTETIDDEGHAGFFTTHVVTYGGDTEVPDEHTWHDEVGRTWSAGVLSRRDTTVEGEIENPRPTDDLVEYVTDDTDGLEHLGVEAYGGWLAGPVDLPPQDGTLLDQRVDVEIRVGVIETAVGTTALAVYAAQAKDGDDVVLAGAVDRRLLGDESPTEAVDRISEDERWSVVLRNSWFRKFIESVGPIDLPPPTIDLPTVTVEDPRLVQICEDSENVNTGDTLDDPPIVRGLEAAALFDLDGSGLDDLPPDGIVAEVTVTPSSSMSLPQSFRIPKEDIKDIAEGASPAVKFHELARDGDASTDPPIFTYSYDEVTVTLTDELKMQEYDTTTWSIDETIETPSLIVGFIEVVDPNDGVEDDFVEWPISYGDDDGRAQFYVETVNSAVTYLRRIMPGTVVAYRYDTPMEANEHEQDGNLEAEIEAEGWDDFLDEDDDIDADDILDVNDDFRKDAEDARAALNNLHYWWQLNPNSAAHAPRYNGEFYADGITESQAEDRLWDHGFDVVVMILPRGTAAVNDNAHYYYARGESITGRALGQGRAVGSLESTGQINPDDNQTGIDNPDESDTPRAMTVAHEIGHYFTDDPYASPSGDPFARTYTKDGEEKTDHVHASSDLESVGYSLVSSPASDEPGFSLISDITMDDGSFDPGSPDTDEEPVSYTSFMSYDGDKLWADSRIIRYLAESQFDDEYSAPAADSLGSVLFAGGGGGGVSATDDDEPDFDPEDADAEKPPAEPVVEAFGRIENGEVVFEQSNVHLGRPVDNEGVDVKQRLQKHDANPVNVALLDRDGEPVYTTVVPDQVQPSHHDEENEHHHDPEPINAVSLSVPFDEQGVWIRAEYGGNETRLNAIVAPLRDAVHRVPDRALGGGAGSHKRLTGALQQVHAAMMERQFGTAVELLEDEFVPALEEEVGEYDPLANEPTAEVIVKMTEQMIGRLERLNG